VLPLPLTRPILVTLGSATLSRKGRGEARVFQGLVLITLPTVPAMLLRIRAVLAICSDGGGRRGSAAGRAGRPPGRQAMHEAKEIQVRQAVGAAVIGNVLEWYDFAVYAYLAGVIGKSFFPLRATTTSGVRRSPHSGFPCPSSCTAMISVENGIRPGSRMRR